MNTRFHFKAQDMETMKVFLKDSSKIRNIDGKGKHADVLCLGQLMALFGEPLYMTEDLENQYSYCILAEDGNGVKVYLEVYSGPSGPAIGGKETKEGREAADELATLIIGAKAKDYDWKGVYADGPCEIKMGVRNGKPYCEERELFE